ncbi:unnamed protein product [Schistosoma margrebowiei]|uniref:Uncharacterized protein n=1 Tax=Schistosoma margrebowiei TaxID=48269 RepID=A0A183LHQ2_9TREM|nr:unnamed protein product [Schistosoma margrebowiei]
MQSHGSRTRQQGVPVILRELVLPGGFDPVSLSFTVKDVTTGLSGFSSQYETKTCCRLVLAKLKFCHNILIMFLTDDGKRPAINNNGALLTDPLFINKDVTLRLPQHTEPDKFSGANDTHARIIVAFADVAVEPLAILL